MQMIDVLTRLAQLDSGNSNVVNPMSKPADKVAKKQTVAESGIKLPELPEPDLNNLKVLSGLQQVNECGPMGMMDSMGGHMEPHRPPATFSINASAADGDEVAGMLSQIMNLAGVHKVGAEPVIGGHDSHDDQGAPAPNDNEIMRSMLDTMNEPEDETTMTALPPPEAGADAGGGLDDLDTGDIAGDLGAGGEPGDLGDMADQVRDMADELSGTSKDELGLESYDNTPADPTDVPAFDANKLSWNPNAGGMNKGVTTQPTATLEDQLYNEYKKFVNEAKKCTHWDLGEKCPVHGMKECSGMYEASHQEKTTMKHVKNPTAGEKKAAKDIKAGTAGYADRVAMLKSAEKDGRLKEADKQTMSRAAKGMMKYGKQGMKALADAGKKGKDLEPVRAKYNKYD
jgi:hypothetical protein